MEIVKMSEEHTAALARLEKLCFSRPWSMEALREELENPLAVFLVATEGEAVLGYAGMHCVEGECYLDNVAVFPEFRRRGVARTLISALEKEGKKRNGEFLSLEVRPSNLGAVVLYLSMGFREEGRRKNFYSDPPEDGLILTLRWGRKEEKEGTKLC